MRGTRKRTAEQCRAGLRVVASKPRGFGGALNDSGGRVSVRADLINPTDE